MTVRHLMIFITVAEQGSMSAAAKSLYLSQPTVSQTIRELEKHYNGLLFERFGKKLYLTERGKLLLPHAKELVQNFRHLEEMMLNQGQAPTLRLGSTITVGTCLTPAFVLDLKKKFTDLNVYSYVSNTRDIEQKLLRSQLDAAIVEGEINAPELTVLPIIDDSLVLAVGKSHPFYQANHLSVMDLNGQNYAMREAGSGTRQLFEDFASRYNISYEITWEANSPRTLLNAVLYDQVLSVMSLRLMEPEIKSRTIHVFYQERGEWDRKFKLVYHKNKFLTPAIYELEKILHKYKHMKLPQNMGILV